MAKILVVVSIAAVLAGCTTAQMYDSLQDEARDDCARRTQTDTAGCKRANSQDYEQYKKERGRAVDGK